MPSSAGGPTDADRTESTAPDHALSRRRLLGAASAAAVGGGLLAGRAGAEREVPVAALQDGPEYDRDEVIREGVWVETDVDTNDSGEPDRVYVEVARPEATDDGEQFPVIAQASPYYGPVTHSDTTEEMLFDRAVELEASGRDGDANDGTGNGEKVGDGGAGGGTGAGAASPAGRQDDTIGPTPLERRYLPRGYVVAYPASVGIGESTGCYTAAGPPTIEGLAAVVEWFDGRATAYDARSGGEPVEATWATGKTGMIGASGNGELANGVATTGVDGLEAVVPQAANNGQYSLFRSNGTPISVVPSGSDRMLELSSWVEAGTSRRPDCSHWVERIEARQDRETGDYNDFWHEREFLTDADDVEAGVLLTHALDDRIVKPNNVADWYEELEAADVPVRLWLHDGGHTTPDGSAWFDLLDRWWAHWLREEDTGVLEEDPVRVIHAARDPDLGSSDTHETWPVPDSAATAVRFDAGGAETGGLALDGGAEGEESCVDDPSTAASGLARAEASEHRLRYLSPALGEQVRVSGRVVPSLSLSLDQATVVSVALVEYSAGGTSTIVTRGWADPQNRPAYGEFDSPVAYKESLRASAPIEPGERVAVEFPLQATDHVFSEGSRLGLVVYGSDREFTLRPPGDAEVTLALGESSVELPVVGGASALDEAFRTEPDPDAGSDGGTGGGEGESAGQGGDGGDGDGDDATDGLPGFGIGGALAALASARALLGRRGGGERPTGTAAAEGEPPSDR